LNKSKGRFSEGHRNLLLTMAMDLSAKKGMELELPIDPAELMAGFEA